MPSKCLPPRLAAPFSPHQVNNRYSHRTPSTHFSPNTLRARSYPLPPPSSTSSTSQAVRQSITTPTTATVQGHLHRSTRTPKFPQLSARFPHSCSSTPQTSANMSAPIDSATAQMANTSLDNNAPTTESTGAQQPTAADDEAVRASAAEGRRLYIGNLAYATTEGELKEFFKDYLVYVRSTPSTCDLLTRDTASPRPSPPTRAPRVPSATPLSRSPPPPRLSVPSPSSTARPSLTARSPSSLPAHPRLTRRAPAAVQRAIAPRPAPAHPPVDAVADVAVAAALDVVDVP